jgi:hypothetical protein
VQASTYVSFFVLVGSNVLLIQPTCFAAQFFRVQGGNFVVTQDGEILFANQYIGQDLWNVTVKNGEKVLECSIKGTKMYVTVDEEGKKLYLSKELEPGSYWEYTKALRGGVETTIRTVKTLKGGPFYIGIDTDNPMKRLGTKSGTIKRETEYTVYPAKITNNS